MPPGGSSTYTISARSQQTSTSTKRKRPQKDDEGSNQAIEKRTRISRTTNVAESSLHNVIDLTSPTPSPHSTSSKKATKRKQTSGDATSTAADKEEKRLRAFRKKAPQTYLVKLERARTQRLFVLNRKRAGTEEAPEEILDVVGSTGNLYQVTVGKVPYCTCPDARKGNQCKHIVYVLRNVLKVASHLQYQLAFLSSELREIFANAPLSLMDNASTEDNTGKRKEIDGDCPICFMEFDVANDEIVWCKAACGNNIHKTCFQKWADSEKGKQVRCVYCRTPWQYDTPSSQDLLQRGYINDEGYINIGESMGLPEDRDYSTYHQPWGRSRYSYY